jgi:multidrug efflux pump subunit AcrA (membrane-fusion protein)
VDPETGSIQARAVFPNPDTAVIAGLFARVLIPRDPKQVLLVPATALQRDLVGSFVLVEVNGEVERRDVVTGELLRARGLQIIDEGLLPTDMVIVNGLQSVRPGRKVDVETTTAEAFIAEALQARSARPAPGTDTPPADGTDDSTDGGGD